MGTPPENSRIRGMASGTASAMARSRDGTFARWPVFELKVIRGLYRRSAAIRQHASVVGSFIWGDFHFDMFMQIPMSHI
jgi:hypothetical protein